MDNNRIPEELVKRINYSIKINTKKDKPIEPNIDCRQILVKNWKNNFTGDQFEFLELEIKASDIIFSSRFMIAIRENSIQVFSYSKNFSLKFLKKVEIHYLLYLKHEVTRRTMKFLGKIYLSLLEDKIHRPESWLEAIVVFIRADQIEEIVEFFNGAMVRYKSGKFRIFNEFLNETTQDSLIKLKRGLKNKVQQIFVQEDSINVCKIDSLLVDVRRVERVKRYVAFNNFIALIHKSKVVIARFKNA